MTLTKQSTVVELFKMLWGPVIATTTFVFWFSAEIKLHQMEIDLLREDVKIVEKRLHDLEAEVHRNYLLKR